jgi:hypothetical protein
MIALKIGETMRILRKSIGLMVVVPLLSFAGNLVAQIAGKEPFTIAISPLRSSVKVGESVNLKIVMTNTSDSEINAGAAWDGSIDAAYEYKVTDSYGNTPPSKPLGEYRPNLVMRTLSARQTNAPCCRASFGGGLDV